MLSNLVLVQNPYLYYIPSTIHFIGLIDTIIGILSGITVWMRKMNLLSPILMSVTRLSKLRDVPKAKKRFVFTP